SVLEEESLHMEHLGDQIYIATKSGLRTIAARRLFTPLNYQFYLRSVKVENQKMPLRNFILSYPDNDITFNFDLLAYRFPDLSLHYDLQGPSGIKGTVAGRDVQLQNLEPGNYILNVYPETDRLNSRRKVISIPFAVKPAFWHTRLFFLAVILSGMGIIFLTACFLKRKKRIRSKVQKLLAEYRLTALKSQINPHFMSNALAAIQQLILSDESDKAGLYLAKFSQLIRFLLEYSDKPVISIASELKLIELYVEIEHLRFSGAFHFRKEIGSNVNLQELFIPSLVTQPLVENAIWHGLLPMGKNKNSELLLKLFIENEALHIAISDNGVGRKPENAEADAHSTRTSKGVGLIRNRIESLNQLYAGPKAAIFYTDHVDGADSPSGTTATLVFPLQLLNTLYHERNQDSHR
ncbi:MAG TPA: histidine kinase, partial [Flavobacterium sp.]|nr:histidine kinase [Flavobacterium sp.]